MIQERGIQKGLRLPLSHEVEGGPGMLSRGDVRKRSRVKRQMIQLMAAVKKATSSGEKGMMGDSRKSKRGK